MAITINVNLDEILAALKNDLDFTGNADKYIKVNATADGFEFAAVSVGSTWGSITGTLSDQTDLQSALDLKANLSGAAFTGDVSVTTSGSGDTLQLTSSGSGTTLNITNSGSGDFLVIDTDKLVVSNNGNLAVDTDTLFVDSVNNRVGVGTSSPSNNFDIKGGNTQLRIGVQDTAGLFLMSNLPSGAFMAGGAEFISAWRARTTSAGLIGTYNGDFRIYLNTSLTANQNYTPTERFTVLSTGNVGINDTSPSAMLEIVSNGVSKVGQIIQAAAGQTANLLEVKNSSGTNMTLITSDGTIRVGSLIRVGPLTLISSTQVRVGNNNVQLNQTPNQPIVRIRKEVSNAATKFLSFIGTNGKTQIAAFENSGAFTPASLADSGAENGTIYYSTDAGKLVYKDSGGVVNDLY